MLWLVVFGVIHAYSLWYGDILYAYGMCGLAVYLFRHRAPRTLIAIGLSLVAVASLVAMFWQVTMPYWPPGVVAEVEAEWWVPPPAAIEAQNVAYRGGWTAQQRYRGPSSFYIQTDHFLADTMWRAGGLMLVGMALFRLGVLSAERSRTFYLRMMAIGFGVGLPIILYGVRYREASDWSVWSAFFGGEQFNYWASLLVAMGWIGLVMLVCQEPRAKPMVRPLAATGRMALSCYLLQTIICTTIFYGHGFGLYGSVDRVGQTGVVLVVWAFLLAACPVWLRHFRFGPFEWLWRSLTYWKLQPMRIAS